MAAPSSTPKIWIFCTIVFAMGFVAASYLNYVQYQNAQEQARQLKGTITDLRYELTVEGKASPSPSASPTATPAPTGTPTPVATATPAPAVTPTPAPPAAATAVTNQLANLHTQPSQSSPTLVKLAAGTTVTLTGAVSNKYQPVTVNGQNGYVLQSYLTY